jgi:hypothetical protein
VSFLKLNQKKQQKVQLLPHVGFDLGFMVNYLVIFLFDKSGV